MKNKLEDYKETASERIIKMMNGEGLFMTHIYEEHYQLWHDAILEALEYKGGIYEATFNDKFLIRFMSDCFFNGKVETRMVHIPTKIEISE